MSGPSRGGVQLWLGFEYAVRAGIPWGGVSPRELTASYERFILKAQAAKSVSDFVDPEQYDLWLPFRKIPFVYRGAPLLGKGL